MGPILHTFFEAFKYHNTVENFQVLMTLKVQQCEAVIKEAGGAWLFSSTFAEPLGR